MPNPTSRSLSTSISERIEKYGLPRTLEKECNVLYEKFMTSHPKQHRNMGGTIDSVLFLLCRRHQIIEPVDLKKAASGHYMEFWKSWMVLHLQASAQSECECKSVRERI
jgi:hypothetical protein